MDAQIRFSNPLVTADGSPRAKVNLRQLDTLWINTGTLCNLTCANCYIESSPSNDRLAYICTAEVEKFLDEIDKEGLKTRQIGFTGGEPFMNPEFVNMLRSTLARGFQCLVLTNAMRPMMKCRNVLLALGQQYGGRLEVRVSLDHFNPQKHEEERGPRSWSPALKGIAWLHELGFNWSVAGRTLWGESDETMRAGFAGLFAAHGLDLDAHNPARLVIFPEMDESAAVPEITQDCWNLLRKSPNDLMCSNSRMVIKRKGMQAPGIVACTLLPYDEAFELGHTLKHAMGAVALNHPHCSKFCVLGGGACSVKEDR